MNSNVPGGFVADVNLDDCVECSRSQSRLVLSYVLFDGFVALGQTVVAVAVVEKKRPRLVGSLVEVEFPSVGNGTFVVVVVPAASGDIQCLFLHIADCIGQNLLADLVNCSSLDSLLPVLVAPDLLLLMC